MGKKEQVPALAIFVQGSLWVRPLILVPTINSRHWNACYLQLLSVQRCQHPPQAERSCWGGGSRPPQQQSAPAGGGVGHDFRCAGGVPSSVRPLLVCVRFSSRVWVYLIFINQQEISLPPRVRPQAHFVYRGGARCRTCRTLRQHCRSLGEGGGVPVGRGAVWGAPSPTVTSPASR